MTRQHLPELDAAQDRAMTFAAQRPGSMLAVGMAGGKTGMAVRLADTWGAMRAVILAPSSAVGVWPTDLHEWSTRDWTAHRADRALGRNGQPLANATISRRAAAVETTAALAAATGHPSAVICNTEAAWQGDMGRVLEQLQPDLLIVDESHRLKSPSGKASRWARRLAHHVRSRGGHVLLLTGTPMPHSPLDIWAQAAMVDSGASLGSSYRLFCATYAKPETIQAGGQIREIYKDLRDDARDAFAAACSAWMYQIPQADIDRMIELDPIVDAHRFTTLDPAARKVYDSLERDLVTTIGDHVVEAANSMVLVMRLAQLSGGYAPTDTGELVPLGDPPAKAKLLADVLDDIPRDAPIVVFARFHADLDAIEQVAASKGLRYAEVSGRRKDGLADDATIAPGVQLLACQLQSGGTGVRLEKAHTAIYYSLDFRLGDYEQSRKRLHRPGQKHQVTLIHLLVEDTIDLAVVGALRKRADGVAAALTHIRNQQPHTTSHATHHHRRAA